MLIRGRNRRSSRSLAAALMIVQTLGATWYSAAAIPWRSPDGSLAISLHDGWERGAPEDNKVYDPRAQSQILPGSAHRLYTGGWLSRRFITLQVVQMSGFRGDAVPQLMQALVQRLQGQGLEVVRTYYDNIQKGFVHYRFTHTGDPVSTYAVLVGTAGGIFYIELNAPREDEDILVGEALQVLNSAVVLRPAR